MVRFPHNDGARLLLRTLPALGHMKVHCVLLEKAMLPCWLADREGNTISKKAPQTQINK